MISLQMGANAPVGFNPVEVTVAWQAGASQVREVDISAFVLRRDRKVGGDGDMIFYGQRRAADGSVEITALDAVEGPHTVTRFRVDSARLGADVESVAFTATIGGGDRSPFASIGLLRIQVGTGAEAIEFEVPRGQEAALIVGELYRRNDAWKFRAVGQGFVGGLQPLAESMGIVVAAPSPSPSPSPAPAPAPAPAPTVEASAPAVSLTKVTLTKSAPSVNLAKKASGYGEVRINLNWNRGTPAPQASGLSSWFKSKPQKVDLDLACLYELGNGSLGAIQALGNCFGDYDRPPFLHLLGDDRTGANSEGEWLRLNGQQWPHIKRVLVYAFIYEGVANWANTDGVITVLAPDQAPIEVRLDNGLDSARTCAIALFENVGGQMRVSREVRYYGNAQEMDRAYHWGLNWTTGSKG